MNEKLKSVAILLLTGIMGGGIQAQTGNVGVNVETPTEVLDVNGVVRVRDLPDSGKLNAIHTTGDNTASATATQTFEPKYFVLADERGVLGRTEKNDITEAADVADLNNSKSIFVIQRVLLRDNADGRNNLKGYDTGMSTAKWEAMLSVPKINYSASGDVSSALGREAGWELSKASINGAEETWTIVGDVFNKVEEGYADILFIKKEFVSVTTNRINDTQSN